MANEKRNIISELYAYGDWANERVLRLCDGLSDEQLDEARELGFGSLRATLFHILEAERIWLGRWKQLPWVPLATDPEGMSLEQIATELRGVSVERAALVVEERATGFERIVEYADSRGKRYAHRIGDLLLHVANHGVHHRAQALHFLKHAGRTIPGGVDYIFYKLAYPDLIQDASAVEAVRAYGMDVAVAPGSEVVFNRSWFQRYFAYADWAWTAALHAADQLSKEQLDHPFEMGIGTVRRNLLHIDDAERWWLRNWAEEGSPFEKLPETTSLNELRNVASEAAVERNAFVAELDEERARRVVGVTLGGGPRMKFRVVESLLQLCTHGTHHRAQVLNMVRRSHVDPPALDLVVWLR